MEFSEYQKKTETTAIYPREAPLDGLLYTSLGLSNEAGEVCGKVKKILRDDGKQITEAKRKEIMGEAGDVLWYLSQLCTELSIDLNEVAAQNLAKLNDRKKRGKISGSGDNR